MAKLKLSALKLSKTELCRNCKTCIALKNCPMSATVPGSSECISCGACIAECPFKAIKLQAQKIK